jgi:Zn-dependent protease with chaperone function
VTKGIGEFILAGLAAPGLGLFASWFGLDRLSKHNDVPVAEMADYCARLDPALVGAGCESVELLTLLQQLSIAALAATIAVPLLYWLCALVLGRSSAALARFFPPLVRVFLFLLPLLLAAHGALVWWATWELIEEGVMPRNWHILAIPLFLGAGLFLSAFSILVDISRLLAIDPLGVTGVVVKPSDHPDLHARVARLAAKLGSRPPERIVIGIEPNAFVASMPIRLRGVEELPAAETLYLSTTVLRVIDDAELDALIAHELGHFRGADLEFSRRFAPAFNSLGQAVQGVSLDDGDDAENPWLRVARLPAIGLLSLMILILGSVVHRIQREREFAADRASLEVSKPDAVVSLLIKFAALTLQWGDFRQGLNRLLDRGCARRNISADYLARTRQYLARATPTDMRALLLEAHTPHPLDSHPTLAARSEAVGISPDAQVATVLAQLRTDRPAPAILEMIEEQVTRIDLDYVRVPGHPIKLSEETALPPELAMPNSTGA